MGPTDGVDISEKKNISCHYRDCTHKSSVLQPAAWSLSQIFHTIEATNALMLQSYFYTQFVITSTSFDVPGSCWWSYWTSVYHHNPAVCLTTGSKPLPKRFLHLLRSRASSFKWEYLLPSLRSSSSFLRLLPCLLVTFISPFIFPSITCFKRQFLRKMWPIQLAFHFLIACRIFLCSLAWSSTSSFLHFSHI